MAHDPQTPSELPPVTYAPRPPRLRRPPYIVVALGLVFVVASWLPLVIFARARTITSGSPRIQIMQDMGTQPRYSAQQSSPVFADGRADRLPVPGTVAKGHLEVDENPDPNRDPANYFRGYTLVPSAAALPATATSTTNPSGIARSIVDDMLHQPGHAATNPSGIARSVPVYCDDFPKPVELNQHLLDRGRLRFNIYCSVCHGYDGKGTGAVNKRASELMETQLDTKDTVWKHPADLTSSAVVSQKNGEIYNTINVGMTMMPPYGAQIPVEDRWAIVAYVRALQLSANPLPEKGQKTAPTSAPASVPATPPASTSTDKGNLPRPPLLPQLANKPKFNKQQNDLESERVN